MGHAGISNIHLNPIAFIEFRNQVLGAFSNLVSLNLGNSTKMYALKNLTTSQARSGAALQCICVTKQIST